MNELIYTPPTICFSSFATLAELIEVKIKLCKSANILKTTNIKEEKGGTQKVSYKWSGEGVRICVEKTVYCNGIMVQIYFQASCLTW